MITLNNPNGLTTRPTLIEYAGRMTVPPIPINAYSSLSTPAYFRAIVTLSENLSSQPRHVTLNGIQLATPHALQKLLERRPNPYQNATMFWRTLFLHAVHYNNGYARIERDKKTQTPVALHNLAPEDIMPFRYTDKTGAITQFYANTQTRELHYGIDIIHLAGASYDGMAGIDGVALHSGTLQSASTQDRYLLKYLQSGTNVRNVIEFQGTPTEEQFERVRTMLRERYSGIDAEDDTLLLGSGATYKNVNKSLHDSQFAEQTTFTTKQIAQITGVDPAFMFDKSESKYSGIAEAGENFVRFTLRPWIDQIENELSLKLLTDAEFDGGHKVSVDTSALIKGDIKTVTDLAIRKKEAGITTGNQALAELGLPKSNDPEADKLKIKGDTSPPTDSPQPG